MPLNLQKGKAMKELDCRNLACPEPVLKSKKALQDLKIGENLNIKLNSLASKENVARFLRSQGFEPALKEKGDDEFEIIVVKDKELANALNSNDESEIYRCESGKKASGKKILFLKSASVGDGELGKKLLMGFLDTLKKADNAPSIIVCVNEAVLINTNSEHFAYQAMKELANKGIEIISCGSCLEFYGKIKDLKTGRIGNALEILNLLFDKDKVVSL